MNTTSPTIGFAPTSKSQSLSNTSIFFALGGLMLLSLALSIFFFMPQSLRLDEAQSLWESGQSPSAILAVVAQDVHVPLYHELLHFWRLYIGDSVMSARLMSMFFYLLSLPAIYALGTLAFSRRVGLMAAIFMAVSPFMNWYGNEIRMYTLFLFLTILNQYFFIRMWKQPVHLSAAGTTSRARDIWIGYAVTAILGVFTHYFFFLNLIAQGVFYALHARLFPRQTFTRLAILATIIIAAFVPWAWYVVHLGEAANQVPLLRIPTTVDVFNTFSQFVLGFQNDHLNTIFLSLWPIGILLGFLALRRAPAAAAHGYETRYLLITVVVSFAIAFMFSIFVLPVFVSRYLIFTLPALYLLLAAYLDTYAWRSAAWGVVALMLGMMAVEIFNPSTPVKENYAEASSYLTAQAGAQDIVIVSVPFTLYPVEYYYTGTAPVATLPAWNQYAHGAIPPYASSILATQVPALAEAHQNMWLLQSYDQGYNKEVKNYFDSHYKLLLAKNFSPGLNLYEYQVRYDTPLTQTSSTAMR